MNGTYQWITSSVALVAFLGLVVTYLAGAGTKARRDILEKNLADVEKRLSQVERERDDAQRERDALHQELDALGRVVTASDAIDRFEKALARHRTELMELLQRIYDLVLSFRSGGRRD